MKKFKYAIIIPSYNNAHGNIEGLTFLEKCIDSIINQTYIEFQVFIVDDLSEDDSVKIIKRYMNLDKRIHLIVNNRKRYNGGSRNVGISYALKVYDFDYFCFLDSDDWWIDENVLETINTEINKRANVELALIGTILHFTTGDRIKLQEMDSYEDLFISDKKVWCTAWSRIIRRDKIVYFCESTLMEDRVWSYRQADNVNYCNVINILKPLYVWNRTNTNNSVSLVRSDFWNASAYCHVGHQLQFITELKHKEMLPLLNEHVNKCIKQINSGIYRQD